MTSSFAQSVAFVTGAGSGIGRATAIRFAQLGARVAVVDFSASNGRACVDHINALGGESIFIQADVTQSEQVDNAIRSTVSAFGRIDVAHNNAGTEGEFATLTESTEAGWDRTIEVNLKSVWLCMRAQIPVMREGGGGAIVNTASVAALVGQAGATAYCASKHGVLGLTKAAALENAKSGIRINAICPGLVRTAMSDRLVAMDPRLYDSLAAASPIGRVAAPEEIAEAVIWLCSPAASYVIGHALTIDGGVVVL
jgi:NAD(P)-dependent dehydrogenase (short-subunit alcohol dehydrogenase family)